MVSPTLLRSEATAASSLALVDLALALAGLALDAVQATFLVSLRSPSLHVALLSPRAPVAVQAASTLAVSAVLPSVLRGWLADSVSLATSFEQGAEAVVLAPAFPLAVVRNAMLVAALRLRLPFRLALWLGCASSLLVPSVVGQSAQSLMAVLLVAGRFKLLEVSPPSPGRWQLVLSPRFLDRRSCI